jgi:hypothetical protein
VLNAGSTDPKERLAGGIEIRIPGMQALLEGSGSDAEERDLTGWRFYPKI